MQKYKFEMQKYTFFSIQMQTYKKKYIEYMVSRI